MGGLPANSQNLKTVAPEPFHLLGAMLHSHNKIVFPRAPVVNCFFGG
jgi:hypothetical protein